MLVCPNSLRISARVYRLPDRPNSTKSGCSSVSNALPVATGFDRVQLCFETSELFKQHNVIVMPDLSVLIRYYEEVEAAATITSSQGGSLKRPTSDSHLFWFRQPEHI